MSARFFRLVARISFATILGVCLHVNGMKFPVGQAHAQDATSRPPRAEEAVAALQRASWEQLEEGLSLHQAVTALGTRLTTLKISPRLFRFSIEQQETPMGERAGAVLRRTGGVVAVNGGFFGQKADGQLYPVGELIDDGTSVSGSWSSVGGYLALNDDGVPDITLSSEGAPEWAREAVQTRPVLIEAGGRWAMRTNGTELERRSLFCVLGDGDLLLMVVSGGGLTLYEAGWVLRAANWGGHYGCEKAIALDGGGSTQLKVRGQSQLDVTGLTPVQNLLVVHRR